ncbi:hypothetical protein [Epilithonimonas mollis]|uniref:Uncharacterized protein n=1 Tax=Epilithonimonas mollis TaxID=216903 RepID=A0A1M6T439_9FLAO|nr:hypothetical protein [Epilithonimonas mollis]SHK51707.1 hypothetical protein SAMN05444371_2629 [Epilithonimonas mollis]
MIFGHFIIKKYRKYKGQGIGTRFVVVGIPLFPVQSFYFLENNRSIEIDLHWKHAVKIYVIVISLIYLLVKGLTRDYYDQSFENSVLYTLIFNALIYFLLDPYTKRDRQIRELLSKAVYINALPKFLGNEMAYNVQKSFIQNYGGGWKDAIKNNTYQQDELPLLFAIITYEVYLYKSDKNQLLFEKLFTEYKKYERIE